MKGCREVVDVGGDWCRANYLGEVVIDLSVLGVVWVGKKQMLDLRSLKRILLIFLIISTEQITDCRLTKEVYLV